VTWRSVRSRRAKGSPPRTAKRSELTKAHASLRAEVERLQAELDAARLKASKTSRSGSPMSGEPAPRLSTQRSRRSGSVTSRSSLRRALHRMLRFLSRERASPRSSRPRLRRSSESAFASLTWRPSFAAGSATCVGRRRTSPGTARVSSGPSRRERVTRWRRWSASWTGCARTTDGTATWSSRSSHSWQRRATSWRDSGTTPPRSRSASRSRRRRSATSRRSCSVARAQATRSSW
jgi:hypothetical protein